MNIPLPSYIDKEAWDGFVLMRKEMEKKKIPFTLRAATMILKTLQELKDNGHDPNASLDQSTLNGWRDVFPAREKRIERISSAVDSTRAYLSEQASIKPNAELARQARQALRAVK